jgi:hypothetical protein
VGLDTGSADCLTTQDVLGAADQVGCLPAAARPACLPAATSALLRPGGCGGGLQPGWADDEPPLAPPQALREEGRLSLKAVRQRLASGGATTERVAAQEQAQGGPGATYNQIRLALAWQAEQQQQ